MTAKIVTEFHCRCGFEGKLAELHDHEAFLMWCSDHDAWEQRSSRAIAAYLAESGAALTPDELAPAEAIWLAIATEDEYTIGVYRCPACLRLYVEDRTAPGTLRCYAVEEPHVTTDDVFR
jgi:hypothetical protein